MKIRGPDNNINDIQVVKLKYYKNELMRKEKMQQLEKGEKS